VKKKNETDWVKKKSGDHANTKSGRTRNAGERTARTVSNQIRRRKVSCMNKSKRRFGVMEARRGKKYEVARTDRT